MTLRLGLLAALLCLTSPLAAQTGFQVEKQQANGNTVVTSEIAPLKSALAQAAQGLATWNACGDQVSVKVQDIVQQGNAAQARVMVNYARAQCVNVPEVTCKGFTCTTQNRRVQNIIAQETAPVTLTITPKIAADTGLTFQVDANAQGNGLVKTYVRSSGRTLKQQTEAQLRTLTQQVTNQVQTPLTSGTAAFTTGETGALELQLQLK